MADDNQCFVKKNLIRLFACFSFSILATNCTRNVVGGSPTIPLSNTNGTTRVFDIASDEVEQALTNAFGLEKYHGMPFLSLTNAGLDHLKQNWHATNGYVLYEGDPVANIPLDTGIVVPYLATFYINLQPQNDMKQITITVRTMHAEVFDGYEQGVHGGQAHHARQIAPVRQGEEDVLEAIAKALNATNKVFK